MVKTMDIINALIKEFDKCIPEVEPYLGGIEEDYKSPAFLFLLIYDGGERSGKFTRDVMIDLQCVYFGETDGYGNQNFEEKMKVVEGLRVFLNQYKLAVGDRVLKFKYEIKDADERLAIFLTFRFKDGVNDPEFEEEQLREAAEELFINEERVV